MKIRATVGTVIVDNSGTREVKAGDVVEVSDRDGAYLVAVGKAEVAIESKSSPVKP